MTMKDLQPGRLGPAERSAALAVMAGEAFDVVIVGGGVVGAGAALDAATRGLSVALLEARDWASGTSSRSSKLVHGGLRYLEMLDFALVREALHERGLILTRLAPHLVRPVPFLYPLKHHVWERPYVAAGVTVYDILARTSGSAAGLPFHRHLTRKQALRAVPSLRSDALVGAVQYFDAQVDDARHTMTIVRTAAAYGAQVASRARVIGFLREGERVVGVRVRDLEHGAEFEVQAQQVINATGVWTDETQAMVGERGQFKVRASKGIHLVVPRDRILSTTGMILRTATSVLFVIPWGRHWIVGTTDTDWQLDKAHPAASSRDIDYLLGQVNTVLSTPLTREDVEGVYAGLRPLLAGESEQTSKLSREHVVAHPTPGLVVVAGGKYTTYRVMAKDAVDEAVRAMDFRVAPSCTDEVPLVGAAGWKAAWNGRARMAAPACTSRGSSTSCTGTAREPTRSSSSAPLRRATPRSASRCPGPTTTSRPRSCTPPRTRAHATWTTSSPAAPGSPSRPGTAGCRRRRTRPGSWPASWGGRRSRSSARCSTTSPGSRPNARRRCSRTTSRRTPPAWALPRSSR
jgi:glycerol-3-phosphate dehydrogenase